jgi:hypothetical protein
MADRPSDHSPPALHGLCWLAPDQHSPLGVTLSPEVSAVGLDDLPDARCELHWFSDPETASAFMDGASLAPRNDVVLHRDPRLPRAVLVGFMSEPWPDTDSIERGIRLVDHGGVSAGRAKVKWAALHRASKLAGKSDLRPLAPWIHVVREDEDEAHVVSLTWKIGPGNADWDVRALPGGRYLLRSSSFPYRAAFDGTWGEFADDGLRSLLDAHSARIASDGMIEIEIPADGFAEAMKGWVPELMEALYPIYEQRRAAHERAKLLADPDCKRILKAMTMRGDVLWRDSGRAGLIRNGVGEQKVSWKLVGRMHEAGLIESIAKEDWTGKVCFAVAGIIPKPPSAAEETEARPATI